MSAEQKPRLTFKEFLDQSANLFAILGVFGAFIVVQPDFKSGFGMNILPGVFLAGFLIVSVVILRFAIANMNGSFSYSLVMSLTIFLIVGAISEALVRYPTAAISYAHFIYLGIVFSALYLITEAVKPYLPGKILAAKRVSLLRLAQLLFLWAGTALIVMSTRHVPYKAINTLQYVLNDTAGPLLRQPNPHPASK